MMTDDFATRRADEVPLCDEYDPKNAPVSCQDAHSDVVQYSTISGFFQNAVLSILVSPTLGAWSGIHGRKPVFMLSQALGIVPICVVILHVQGVNPASRQASRRNPPNPVTDRTTASFPTPWAAFR